MKNKNLYSICFCMALAGSLQTTYGQVDAEGVADSTLSAAGGETDSLQIVVQREMNKIPTVVYKGALVDAATGGPVQGGIIQVAGDDRFSSISDEQGAFEIKVPLYANQLLVRTPTYALARVHLAGKGKELVVRMYSEHFSNGYANEVRVTNKSSVGDFSANSSLTVEDEMAKKLGADLRVLLRSGNPAQGANMFIGGYNSLNGGGQPLFVVDGVILDTQNGRSLMHEGYVNNVLSAISVNDIEKVTVLKNATALYGAKGANGVVVIETKRAKSMATRIDVDIYGAVELLPKLPSMMNAGQYRLYATDVMGNVTETPDFLDDFTTDKQKYAMYHNDTDWKDYVYHEAFTQNYGVNVQGGDDVANYNLSIGYANAQSTLKYNDFARLNMRFNTDVKFMKNLDCSLDVAYSNTTRNLRDDGMGSGQALSPGMLGLIKSPVLAAYNPDQYGRFTASMADYDCFNLSNPLSILENGDASNKNRLEYTLFSLSAMPKWKINRNLTLSEKVSYVLNNVTERSFIPDEGVPTFTESGDDMTANRSRAYSSKQLSVASDTRIDWSYRYGGHVIHLFGGFRYLSDSFNSDAIRADNSAGDKLPNITNEMKNRKVDGIIEEWKSTAVYVNADWNYADKYFLLGTLTAETSTRFGRNATGGVKLGDYVWGIFPSLQAAWVVSAEPFFQNVKGIDYLKLNVGIDQSGNDNIDCFASRSYFAPSAFLNHTSGLSLANIGNDKLKWETVTRISVGLDMSVWNDRLSLGFNYYKSYVNNMLAYKTLGGVSGLRNYWSNEGKMENQGFDVAAVAKVMALKDFSWEISASVGHYKNEVTALPDNDKTVYTSVYGGEVMTKVGNPVGLFYGYKTQGVFATSEEAAETDLRNGSKNGSAFRAGDVHFSDLVADGVIDNKDKDVIGNPNPDVFGNFGTSLHYKNWTLDAFFSYSLGNDIYNYQRAVLESGNSYYNQTTAMLNRWTSEGQLTSIPRVEYGDRMGNARFSDRWIEDGSYLKLKTLSLSYRFPFNLTFLQGITVWGAANNLFTCTKYLGSDPELSISGNPIYQGIDRGLLGHGRSFVLGVKINL